MTRGEARLNYRRPCPPEALASVRQRELAASLARIGVEEQRSIGYPDGWLDQIPREDGLELVHAALVEFQPDVIVTFGSDGFTGHPDHKALSEWVTAALEHWDKPETQLLHITVSTAWRDSFVPPLNEFDFFWPGHPIASARSDVTLRLNDELLGTKVDALRAHASQMKVLFDSYGDDFMRAMASVEHFSVAPTTPTPQPCGCMASAARRDSLTE